MIKQDNIQFRKGYPCPSEYDSTNTVFIEYAKSNLLAKIATRIKPSQPDTSYLYLVTLLNLHYDKLLADKGNPKLDTFADLDNSFNDLLTYLRTNNNIQDQANPVTFNTLAEFDHFRSKFTTNNELNDNTAFMHSRTPGDLHYFLHSSATGDIEVNSVITFSDDSFDKNGNLIGSVSNGQGLTYNPYASDQLIRRSATEEQTIFGVDFTERLAADMHIYKHPLFDDVDSDITPTVAPLIDKAYQSKSNITSTVYDYKTLALTTLDEALIKQECSINDGTVTSKLLNEFLDSYSDAKLMAQSAFQISDLLLKRDATGEGFMLNIADFRYLSVQDLRKCAAISLELVNTGCGVENVSRSVGFTKTVNADGTTKNVPYHNISMIYETPTVGDTGSVLLMTTSNDRKFNVGEVKSKGVYYGIKRRYDANNDGMDNKSLADALTDTDVLTPLRYSIGALDRIPGEFGSNKQIDIASHIYKYENTHFKANATYAPTFSDIAVTDVGYVGDSATGAYSNNFIKSEVINGNETYFNMITTPTGIEAVEHLEYTDVHMNISSSDFIKSATAKYGSVDNMYLEANVYPALLHHYLQAKENVHNYVDIDGMLLTLKDYLADMDEHREDPAYESRVDIDTMDNSELNAIRLRYWSLLKASAGYGDVSKSLNILTKQPYDAIAKDLNIPADVSVEEAVDLLRNHLQLSVDNVIVGGCPVLADFMSDSESLFAKQYKTSINNIVTKRAMDYRSSLPEYAYLKRKTNDGSNHILMSEVKDPDVKTALKRIYDDRVEYERARINELLGDANDRMLSRDLYEKPMSIAGLLKYTNEFKSGRDADTRVINLLRACGYDHKDTLEYQNRDSALTQNIIDGAVSFDPKNMVNIYDKFDYDDNGNAIGTYDMEGYGSGDFYSAIGNNICKALSVSGCTVQTTGIMNSDGDIIETPDIWIDDNGVIKYKYIKTVGYKDLESDNIKLKGKSLDRVEVGYIGQVFPRNKEGVIITKWGINKDELIIPCSSLHLEEHDGITPTRERLRYTTYYHSTMDAVRRTVASDVSHLSYDAIDEDHLTKMSIRGLESVGYGSTTSLNVVYRRMEKEKLPIDAYEKAKEGDLTKLGKNSAELRAFIIDTKHRGSFSKSYAENANTLAISKEVQPPELRRVVGIDTHIEGNNIRNLNGDALGYIDPHLTGSARSQGKHRTIVETARIDLETKEVIPGEVGDSCATIKLPQYKHAIFDSIDRKTTSLALNASSLHTTAEVGTIWTNLEGATYEDGFVVSKEFADTYKVSDGNGGLRPLKCGDKISNFHADKGVISLVVDPDCPADNKTRLAYPETHKLFANNRNIQVAQSMFSLLSRSNGGGVHDMRSKVEPLLKNDGDIVPGGIGYCQYAITDMTATKKNKMYDSETIDDPSNSIEGRKASVSLQNALHSHGATEVIKNLYENNDTDIIALREHFFALGMDITPDGRASTNYVAREEDATPVISVVEMADFSAFEQKNANFLAKHNSYTKTIDVASVSDIRGESMPPSDTTNPELADSIVELVNTYPILGDDILSLEHSDSYYDYVLRDSKCFIEIPEALASELASNEVDVKCHRPTHDYIVDGNGNTIYAPSAIDHKGVNLSRINCTTKSTTEGMVLLPVLDASYRKALVQSNFKGRNRETSMYARVLKNAAIYKQCMGAEAVLTEFCATKGLDYNKILNTHMSELSSDELMLKSLTYQLDKTKRVAVSSCTSGLNSVVTGVSHRISGKKGLIRNGVLTNKQRDSATSVWSGHRGIGTGEIGVGSSMMTKLGIKTNDNLVIWRDPLLTDGGVRALKVVELEDTDGIAINPLMSKSLDGDFDGDTVGSAQLSSRDAKRQARLRLSTWANLVDRGDGEPGEHPLYINSGMDVAMRRYYEPELDKRWVSLEERANIFSLKVDDMHRKLDDGEISSVDYFAKMKDIEKEGIKFEKEATELSNDLLATCCDLVMDFTSPYTILEAYDKAIDCGAKGKKSTFPEVARKHLGFTFERDENGAIIESSVIELPKDSKEITDQQDTINTQIACGVKVDATGLAGTATLKMATVAKNTAIRPALNLTYGVTQGLMGVKRDPKDALNKHKALSGGIDLMYKGLAIDLSTGTYIWDEKNNCKKRATLEEFKSYYIFYIHEGMGVPYNSVFLDELCAAIEDKDKPGYVMDIEASMTTGPLDRLAFRYGDRRKEAIIDTVIQFNGEDLFKGPRMSAAKPALLKRELGVNQSRDLIKDSICTTTNTLEHAKVLSTYTNKGLTTQTNVAKILVDDLVAKAIINNASVDNIDEVHAIIDKMKEHYRNVESYMAGDYGDTEVSNQEVRTASTLSASDRLVKVETVSLKPEIINDYDIEGQMNFELDTVGSLGVAPPDSHYTPDFTPVQPDVDVIETDNIVDVSAEVKVSVEPIVTPSDTIVSVVSDDSHDDYEI